MTRRQSDRARRYSEMLATAKSRPGVAALIEVLSRWQKLDDIQRRAQQAKPTAVAASDTSTRR